jgi:hypothetical protein
MTDEEMEEKAMLNTLALGGIINGRTNNS